MGDNILATMTVSLSLIKFNLHDSILIFREIKEAVLSVYLIYSCIPIHLPGLASIVIVLFTLHVLTTENIVIIQFCLWGMYIGESKQH